MITNAYVKDLEERAYNRDDPFYIFHTVNSEVIFEDVDNVHYIVISNCKEFIKYHKVGYYLEHTLIGTLDTAINVLKTMYKKEDENVVVVLRQGKGYKKIYTSLYGIKLIDPSKAECN